MDRKIEKSTWNKKRILTIVGITALLALIVGAIYGTAGKSKYNAPIDRITISEIKKGPFQEFIPVNGVVLPQITIYLDALNKTRLRQKTKLSKSTMYSALKHRNPTIKTLAKIMHASTIKLSKLEI